MVETEEEGAVFRVALAELSTEQQLHWRGVKKHLGFAAIWVEAQVDGLYAANWLTLVNVVTLSSSVKTWQT